MATEAALGSSWQLLAALGRPWEAHLGALGINCVRFGSGLGAILEHGSTLHDKDLLTAVTTSPLKGTVWSSLSAILGRCGRQPPIRAAAGSIELQLEVLELRRVKVGERILPLLYVVAPRFMKAPNSTKAVARREVLMRQLAEALVAPCCFIVGALFRACAFSLISHAL